MNRMRKVLIADDEVKVGQLVKRLIQWDRLGLTCIGLVTDGQAAYGRLHGAQRAGRARSHRAVPAGSADHGYPDAGIDGTGNDPEGIRAGREMPFYSCQWI